MFNWHTAGKGSLSLRSPWVNISISWLKVEALAVYKLGNGSRIAFWLNPWLDKRPLKVCFLSLFRIALNPNGSVSERWDTSYSSWSIFFGRLLKEEEIIAFLNLLSLISERRVTNCLDKRIWSLQANGAFSVKSLVTHLSLASPLDKQLEKALWKSKCPCWVNITVWIMLFAYLNCSLVMPRKLPSHCLSPNVL